MIGFLTIFTGAILAMEGALTVSEPGPFQVGCLIFVAVCFLFQLVIWSKS